MPELRHDPLRDFWVLISPEREKRPQEFAAPPPPPRSETLCPFCPGHESETPTEVYADRPEGSPPNSPGWQLRVVPNLYPAVMPEACAQAGSDACVASSELPSNVFTAASMPAIGQHEVVIETPRHDARFHEYTPEEAARVFLAYRQRMQALRAAPTARYAMFFRNHGAAAGASLAHPHSQLISLPITPPGITRQLAAAAEHMRVFGRSYARDLIARAEDEGRVVCEHGNVVALCPYASRFPYEITVVPREGSSHYEVSSEELLAATAVCTQRALAALAEALADPPFNWLLATAPFDTLPCDHYHWNIEIFPRLVGIAGFEWGTGCYINPVYPEQAAERMRKTLAAGKAS